MALSDKQRDRLENLSSDLKSAFAQLAEIMDEGPSLVLSEDQAAWDDWVRRRESTQRRIEGLTEELVRIKMDTP